MKRSRECVHCGHIFAELSELSISEDIMGIKSSEVIKAEATENALIQSEAAGVQRMKVVSWYWKVISRKRDGMPILRVDFYGEDKLPKQLFLYLMPGCRARRLAYRQLKSLLQGVRLPEIKDGKDLQSLAAVIRENFAPPSWIEYSEEVVEGGRIHFTISDWGF